MLDELEKFGELEAITELAGWLEGAELLAALDGQELLPVMP